MSEVIGSDMAIQLVAVIGLYFYAIAFDALVAFLKKRHGDRSMKQTQKNPTWAITRGSEIYFYGGHPSIFRRIALRLCGWKVISLESN